MIEPERRAVVPAAMAVAERTGKPAVAIELPDGQLVTGQHDGAARRGFCVRCSTRSRPLRGI